MNKPSGYGIAGLRLSERTYNCLRRAGIDTIGQLLNTPEEKLKLIRNLGAASLREIREALEKSHVSLADEMLREAGYEKKEPQLHEHESWEHSENDSEVIIYSNGNCIFRDGGSFSLVSREVILACTQKLKEMGLSE